MVVPLDGSALAEAALPPAAALARACDAALVLVSVVDSPDAVEDRRAALAARTPALDVPEVDLVVRADVRPSTAIAETAGKAAASIVCMATHGRSGIGRAVLGSVAEATLDELGEPLLLVGESCPSFASPVDGEVLAWVDSAVASGGVAELAARWATGFRQPLELVRAGGSRQSAPEEEALVARLASQEPGPIRVELRVLAGQRPARGLRSLLAERRPGLVVVGTERRRGLPRPASGGVSMRVVHDAPCPVLLLPVAPT